MTYEQWQDITVEAKNKLTMHGLAGVFSKISLVMIEPEAKDPNAGRMRFSEAVEFTIR